MPQVQLGVGAPVIDLSAYAKKAGETFTGTTTLAGLLGTDTALFKPGTDIPALTARAGVNSPVSPVFAALPAGTGGSASSATRIMGSGAVSVAPAALTPGTSTGLQVLGPVAAVNSGGATVPTGTTSINLSQPLPAGSYVLDTAASGKQETVTITGVATGSGPTYTHVISATTQTHAHGTLISPSGNYALSVSSSAVAGNVLQWLDGSTGSMTGRITGGGAVAGSVPQNSFGTLSAAALTTLTVLATGTNIVALRARRNASGQTADILSVEDEAGAVLSKFSKAGRFVTRVAAAPVLADLSDGDTSLHTDASGNLVVTSRVGGALKTATVTVA